MPKSKVSDRTKQKGEGFRVARNRKAQTYTSRGAFVAKQHLPFSAFTPSPPFLQVAAYLQEGLVKT
jgi:hypothetical protein